MIGLRRFSSWLLAVALGAQLWYEVLTLGKEPVTFAYVLRIGLVVGCSALIVTRGRVRMLETLVCIWIALDFAYAIADRFGLIGPYGSPGVSWGNWKNFVTYTRILNGLLPPGFAPFLAVAATVYESLLAIALPLERYRGLAALAASLLTATYVVTMSFTSGFRSQFGYAVVLICATCLYVTSRSVTRFTGDRASDHPTKVAGERAT